MPALEVTQWEPYDGEDAAFVADQRKRCDASNILFRVERALNIMLFHEQDENEIDPIIYARRTVHATRILIEDGVPRQEANAF